MIPRWLSWVFLGVMAYMMYAASLTAPHEAKTSNNIVPAITKDSYPALAELTDAERWKRRLDPAYAAADCGIPEAAEGALGLKIITEKAGAGEGAICSETITIALTIWNAQGGKAFDGKLPITLGENALAKGLDAGLVGIKPAETRTIILPPTALTRAKDSKADAAALKALPTGKLAMMTVTRVEEK